MSHGVTFRGDSSHFKLVGARNLTWSATPAELGRLQARELAAQAQAGGAVRPCFFAMVRRGVTGALSGR